MFRVELFVEDKRLAELLRSVAGLVRGQPSVAPVVNVETTSNGELKASGSGNLVDMFAAWLRKSHKKELRPKEIGEWLEKSGFSKLSNSYLSKNAVKTGLMTKTGKSASTVYHVKGSA